MAEVSLVKLHSRWMPLDFTDDKSTLVQVMAWCRQATSHYLSQCWPRFMSPYGVTRPQWVKMAVTEMYIRNSRTLLAEMLQYLSEITQLLHIDGVLELRLSSTNPSIYFFSNPSISFSATQYPLQSYSDNLSMPSNHILQTITITSMG